MFFVRQKIGLKKKVCKQAAAIAALARITVQDSRKLLPDKFYPSWIVFSQRQKLSFIFWGFN